MQEELCFVGVACLEGMDGRLIRNTLHRPKQVKGERRSEGGWQDCMVAVQAPGESNMTVSWLFSIPYDLRDFPDACVAVCNLSFG